MFENNPKRFYHELRKQKQTVTSSPKKERLENFWKEIYEDSKEHNKEVDWIQKKKKKQHLKEMPPVIIDEEKRNEQKCQTLKAQAQMEFQISG